MGVPGVAYDTIDQYVDWGGHTVTVDPVHRERWIHESHHNLHADHRATGRARRAGDVAHLQSILAQPSARAQPFLPTVADVFAQSHIKRPGVTAYTEHGAVAPFDHEYQYRDGFISDSRPSTRPVVEEMHRNGTLAEGPSKDEIQRQITASRHSVQTRVFMK